VKRGVGTEPPDAAPAPGERAGSGLLLTRKKAEHVVEDVLREGADAVRPARHGCGAVLRRTSGVLGGRAPEERLPKGWPAERSGSVRSSITFSAFWLIGLKESLGLQGFFFTGILKETSF
jgi:hypothetical protein